MNAIVPPAVKSKSDNKAPKAVKPPKAPKAPKAPADPNAPKKTRNVVTFPKAGVVRVLTPEAEVKFRGKRLDYYTTLQAHDGKTVAELLEAFKAKNDEKGGGPGSWLRWFVDNKLATVETPAS